MVTAVDLEPHAKRDQRAATPPFAAFPRCDTITLILGAQLLRAADRLGHRLRSTTHAPRPGGLHAPARSLRTAYRPPRHRPACPHLYRTPDRTDAARGFGPSDMRHHRDNALLPREEDRVAPKRARPGFDAHVTRPDRHRAAGKYRHHPCRTRTRGQQVGETRSRRASTTVSPARHLDRPREHLPVPRRM